MNGLPPTTSTTTTPSPTTNAGGKNSTVLANRELVSTDTTATSKNSQKTPISTSFLVKQSIPLDQSQIQQLRQLNPSLFTQLQQQAQEQLSPQHQRQSPTAQASLYFNRLSGETQNLNIISTVELLKGSLLVLNQDQNGQWLTNPKSLIQASLQQLLRQLIPQQSLQNQLSTTSTSQLLKTLSQLTQLPSNIQSQLLSPQVQNHINQILQSQGIVKATPHVSAPQIQQAIQQGQLILSSNSVGQNSIKTNNEVGVVNQIQTALNSLQKLLSSETNRPSLLNHLETTDKRNLAQLLQPIFSAVHSQQSTTNPQNQPLINIESLLALLGLKVSKDPNQNQQQLKETVKLKLMQAINASKENGLINQIRSLSRDSSQENFGTRINTLYSDIPIRWGEQLLPMQLSIQEKLEQEHENNGAENNKDNITRRWQVFLSLELPDNNTLHTQFTLIRDTISVILWTESHQLSENIKNHLDELRNNLSEQGLTVEDLTCFKGTPPNADNRIDYNLVDIKT